MGYTGPQGTPGDAGPPGGVVQIGRKGYTGYQGQTGRSGRNGEFFLLKHYTCKCRPNFRLTVKFGKNWGTSGWVHVSSFLKFRLKLQSDAISA